MHMNSASVNVIIVPDNSTLQKVRALGKILGENYESYYTIADITFIPHATIYQAQYPVRNLEKVKDELTKITESFKPFDVSLGPYQNFHGYIWWNISENEGLNRLHKQIVDRLNPLREGLLLPHFTSVGYKTGEKFTEKEAEIVRKYGSPVVDYLFQPHITLARLKKDIEESDLYRTLGKAESSFYVSEILIGEMGDHGTLIKILERYG